MQSANARSGEDTKDARLRDAAARPLRVAVTGATGFVGGLAPEGHRSAHLESRLEVEGGLRASGIALTACQRLVRVGEGLCAGGTGLSPYSSRS